MRTRLLGRVLCCGVLGLALAGCSHPTGDVSGTVQYKGKKIPLGRITFQGQEGRAETFGGEIRDGHYEVKGVPTGPVKVAVESYGRGGAGAPPKNVPKGLLIMPKEQGESQVVKALPIPPHYAIVDQSGLSYEVTAGPQQKDFDLK